jgi:lysophospholipase L1-like esterase
VEKNRSIIIVFCSIFLVLAIIVTLVLLIRYLSSSFTKLSETERGSKPVGFILMNETAKKGQTVFAGDSITENYRVSEFFSGYTAETGCFVYNRGISGEVSEELKGRFEQSVLTLAPRNIVILIGTNDLGQGKTPADIAKNIAQILSLSRSACPEANIILEAVYPTNPTVNEGLMRKVLHGRRTAENIRALNNLLEETAKEYGAVWLDLTGSLADESGNLNKKFTFDGLHLNAAGYNVVTERILPLLK